MSSKPTSVVSPVPGAGDIIAVWFSCGAASAVAAKLTIEKYAATNRVRIVNNPVKEEDEDNRRFLKDVEQWLGIEVEEALHPKYPTGSAVDVWNDRSYMAGPQGAPCTAELKKRARQFWEKDNKPEWHVLGFTADEIGRHTRFVRNERDNVLPILIDAGLSKDECFRIVADAGIALPRVYSQGYPNANCIGCVKATSPTYWNHVRKVHPEVFQERADQSAQIGAKLVRFKGKRIQLHDLPADAIGRPMKSMNVECGIFCEERA